jgi:hypothetical protein
MSAQTPDFYIGISTQNPPTIISIGQTIDGMEEVEVRLDQPDEDTLNVFKEKIDKIVAPIEEPVVVPAPIEEPVVVPAPMEESVVVPAPMEESVVVPAPMEESVVAPVEQSVVPVVEQSGSGKKTKRRRNKRRLTKRRKTKRSKSNK